MTFDDTSLPLLPDLKRLIERHGAWSVGFAYLRAAVVRRRRPPPFDFRTLSPHLRRDIGLPPWHENRPDAGGWPLR